MEGRIWRVAAYSRVDREGGNQAEFPVIDSQREFIRDFVSRCPDLLLVQEYVDNGFSGVNFDRPGFRAMMADLQARRVDCIICTKLSRFGRNCIDIGCYLVKTLPAMGVRFIAIDDNYDSYGEYFQSDSGVACVNQIYDICCENHFRRAVGPPATSSTNP